MKSIWIVLWLVGLAWTSVALASVPPEATATPTLEPTERPTTARPTASFAPSQAPTQNDTSEEFLSAELKSSAYICLAADANQERCFGISPGPRDPVYDPNNLYRLQLKRRTNNEAKGEDYRKTRWTINRVAGQMRLTNFTTLCIGRDFAKPKNIVLQQCAAGDDTSVAQWDLTAFLGKDPLEKGLIRTKSAKDMCLTVLKCQRNFNNNNPDSAGYCNYNFEQVATKMSEVEPGAFIKLRECKDEFAFAQTFRQTVDCAPNCLPRLLSNKQCDMACANDACGWDNGYCATPSPTPPTLSPTFSPSTSPTVSPSASPTTSMPSASPTTSLPTTSPTSAPTTTRPSTAPTTSRPTSQSPTSSSPTLQPTGAPSTSEPSPAPTKAPTGAPINVTLTAPTPKSRDLTPLWIVLGILAFCCCCVPIAVRVKPSEEEQSLASAKDNRVSVELMQSPVDEDYPDTESPTLLRKKEHPQMDPAELRANAAVARALDFNSARARADTSDEAVFDSDIDAHAFDTSAAATNEDVESQSPARPARAALNSASTPETIAGAPPPPPALATVNEEEDDSPEALRARRRAAAELGIRPTASGRYLPFGAKPAQNWDGGHAPGEKEEESSNSGGGDGRNIMRSNSKKFVDEVLLKHMSGRFQPLPPTAEAPTLDASPAAEAPPASSSPPRPVPPRPIPARPTPAEPMQTPPRPTRSRPAPDSASPGGAGLMGARPAFEASPAPSVAAEPSPSSPSQTDYEKLSIKQLKTMIRARGGDPSGFVEKAELVAAVRELY